MLIKQWKNIFLCIWGSNSGHPRAQKYSTTTVKSKPSDVLSHEDVSGGKSPVAGKNLLTSKMLCKE
jgi:hypothetical protein